MRGKQNGGTVPMCLPYVRSKLHVVYMYLSHLLRGALCHRETRKHV